MKLKLENFQSIEYAELEFPKGITIIQGKNGSGKSAIFRAIKGLLTNPSGKSGYVKHGTNETRVTLDNNESSVTWVRTPSSCAYINNLSGEVYSKASKLDSRDIADLGFYFDSKDRVVNIHDTWSVLFPFGETDADMFKLFEDVFNISCSSLIIDELKKDESSYKGIISDLNQKIDTCNQTLQNNQQRLQIIDEAKVTDLGKCIKELNDRVTLFENTLAQYHKVKPLCLRAVPEPITVEAIQELDDYCKRLEESLVLYDRSLSYLKFSGVELNLALFSFEDIDIPFEEYQENRHKVNALSEEISQLLKRQKELEQEISKVKVCPVCGRPLD